MRITNASITFILGAIHPAVSSVEATHICIRHNERSICANLVPMSMNLCSYRGIRTNSSQNSSSKDNGDRPKTANIDEFRAKEEKIEREYEEKQRLQSEDDKQEQHKEQLEESEKIKSIRTQILDAAIPFVKTHGWSREAIARGAESLDYPSVAHGMFPKGSIELIHHFYANCNREVIEQLQKELDEKAATDDTHVNPVEFSTRAVRLRLEKLLPFLDSWPQAMGTMTLPPNVPTSLAQLLTLVDDICYLAGDRSVDVSSIEKWQIVLEVNVFFIFPDRMVYTACGHRIHLQND